MIPVQLSTDNLVLDQPTIGDAVRVTEYCSDPVFERFMTLPWPYEEKHAVYFLERHVPEGWSNGSEYTWALRTEKGGELLGVIGFRTEAHDIGYWIGAPHRGNGYMTEALGAVADWVFSQGVPLLTWECVAGNLASATVARRNGFRFTGEGPTRLVFRDGSRPLAWHGVLEPGDDRAEKPGWP